MILVFHSFILFPLFGLCVFFFISRFLDEKKRHLRGLVLFCFVEFEVFPLWFF